MNMNVALMAVLAVFVVIVLRRRSREATTSESDRCCAPQIGRSTIILLQCPKESNCACPDVCAYLDICRRVRDPRPGARLDEQCAAAGFSPVPPRQPEDSLEAFMAKVRKLSSEARPGQRLRDWKRVIQHWEQPRRSQSSRRRRLPFVPQPRNTIVPVFSTGRSSC